VGGGKRDEPAPDEPAAAGSERGGAADGTGLPGLDALLGALGGALRSGSVPPGWTTGGWSNAWSAAARDVPPELADHVLAATSQLLGAVKGFVEVAERVVDEQRARRRDAPTHEVADDGDPPPEPPPAPKRRVRRIPLDDQD
jgi:hypothetical protein